MLTGTEIEIKLFDVTAKSDSIPSCTGAWDFVNINDMKTDNLELPACATLEKDFFRLDGSMEAFPDSPSGRTWGLWSKVMSGADGCFATPPVLKIGFSKSHSSIGVTLCFDEREQDWCKHLRINWLDKKGNTISVRDFYPTEAVYFAKNKMENYWGIEITFIETRKPYRYLKLAGINYGLRLLLDKSDITTAKILEETDLSGNSISVNTLNFSVYSQEKQFSPMNPEGIFSLLQQKQKLEVYAILENQRQYMGSYYLESWESGPHGDIKLHGVDAVGLMDKVQFLGGIYEGTTAEAIVSSIFEVCGLKYEMETELGRKRLWGQIKAGSARDALWQAAFAAGGAVDCSRNSVARIYAPPVRPSVLIGHDRKFAGQRLKQKPSVTGIEVTAHRFIKGGEISTAFDDNLQRGSYTILLSEAMYDVAASGAVITASGANYVKLRADTSGKVTVSGKRYIDTKQIIYAPMPGLAANLTENRLSVKSATLVSEENVQDILKRLTDYYSRGYLAEFSMIMGVERTADMVAVKTMEGENLKGVIESMELDLTGGCVARISVCAERVAVVKGYFTGEIFAGETQGVM